MKTHSELLRCELCHFETYFATSLSRHKVRIHEYPDDAESIISINSQGSNTSKRNNTTIEDELEDAETLECASIINVQNLMDANISIQTNFLESCGAFADVCTEQLGRSKHYNCPNSSTKFGVPKFTVNYFPIQTKN